VELRDFFARHRRVAIAFSGGVDSAYLLSAARQYAEELAAYYVKSDFQPEFELEDARRLAGQLDLPLTVLHADVLSDPQVAANPPDRCYYCKRKIFSAIAERAKADGFDVILDGTNASDDAGDRPGMKALKELSVLSPLRECGLTKSRIRELSKKAGLCTWDKPAYACLATRIPHGTPVTREGLSRTERAEAFLMSLGFSDFRVRTVVMGGRECAKLEVRKAQLSLLLEQREKIRARLRDEYGGLLLDLEARDE
jgi:uncharacterized protein